MRSELRLSILALLLSLPAGAPQEKPSPRDKEFETQVRPLLETYCFGCHGPKKQKAKVDLSTARGEGELARNQPMWIQAAKQLKTRAMPPDDEKKQPSDAEREKLIAWLEGAMDRIDDRAPRDPGRVTIRRLNRAEYNNTLRDLVGLDLHPADDFPLDDVSEGFDTLGDVLSLPPLLLERYVEAADRVLDQAMVTEGPAALLEKKVEGAALAKDGVKDGVLDLPFEREVSTRISVPAGGRYEVRVRASQKKAAEGAAVLVVFVDGVDMALIRVQAEQGKPEIYSGTFTLQAGERKLALRHTPHRAANKGDVIPDTHLFLESYEIAGPERSLSHRRIFGVEGEDRESARRILDRFAARAFRRPLGPGESDRLLALYDAARKKGKGFAPAVRQGLWSILVSPHFIFRVERDGSDRDESGACRLNDWELASRLSYFLWSTMPDETLLDLAAKGKLRDPAVLREQAKRMLADPKARALSDNFAGQWLGLRKLDTIQPDHGMFPSFNETLRRAMIDEPWMFFDRLMRDDRSILELVDADYSYLNEALARHYGIKDVKGDAMRRVELKDPNRGGVLTMAGILTLTSHPTRTSAVKRGKWILDEILGAPPPPPPPNVPELNEASKDRPDAKTLSLRQRLELHRSDPQCFGCHKRMDVLGLGMENYDPIGRWRENENGKRIDVAGTLPAGERFSTPGQLKKLLAGCKEDFARALAEKMFVFALGRATERCDRREIRRVVESLRRNDYRFSALIEEVVTSYPFRHRRLPSREESR
ncbi:MAG: DUF1592 domain-containing protein [Planctomycetes bacterium]|nr:DUF1592 domain-containing protein [Planctomycetota bacterium]